MADLKSPFVSPKVGVPGVAFTPPPISIMAQATQVIESMTKTLPPDANGAIVGIATTTGWNAAVVHRQGDHFVTAAWLGKSWTGGLTGGAAIRATW